MKVGGEHWYALSLSLTCKLQLTAKGLPKEPSEGSVEDCIPLDLVSRHEGELAVLFMSTQGDIVSPGRASVLDEFRQVCNCLIATDETKSKLLSIPLDVESVVLNTRHLHDAEEGCFSHG